MTETGFSRRPEIDDDWMDVAAEWQLRSDTIYLNHGSFGPPPRAVQEAQQQWRMRLYEQPMDFFVRQLPHAWHAARAALATFVGAEPEDIVFVENATCGMNIIAQSIALRPGDEILLTDHEYGAVLRIWQRRAAECNARVRTVCLPVPVSASKTLIETIVAAITPQTRVVVFSHITSPTAIVLPVAELMESLRGHNVITIVDGPHALAQVPVNVRQLGCDFYTASCHKWLSAPFGSGMLYVAPRWQDTVKPIQLSWGLLPPERPDRWWQEFYWQGTRDPSAYLATAEAIAFLERIGLEAFRARCHSLAQYARCALTALFGTLPLVPDSPQWYGAMAHVPLPACDARQVQNRLWSEWGIEVPIVSWNGANYVRVSCHLYTRRSHLDRLVAALEKIFR